MVCHCCILVGIKILRVLTLSMLIKVKSGHSYPEWPHRQGGWLALRRHRLYYAQGAQGGTAHVDGGTAHVDGGATSQLDLPSLTPLSVVGCGRLQLGVHNLATSVDCCK